MSGLTELQQFTYDAIAAGRFTIAQQQIGRRRFAVITAYSSDGKRTRSVSAQVKALIKKKMVKWRKVGAVLTVVPWEL